MSERVNRKVDDEERHEGEEEEGDEVSCVGTGTGDRIGNSCEGGEDGSEECVGNLSTDEALNPIPNGRHQQAVRYRP